MNRRGEQRQVSITRIIIALVIVGAVLYAGWFFLMSYVNCESRDCFNANLAKCIRTKYISGGDTIYEYIILGKEGEQCEVQVTLLQGELNNQDSQALEGKQMTCNLPLGVIMNPESDISNCQGPLKEGLQDLIIQKLHAYLVQNLGRINLEVLDIPTRF